MDLELKIKEELLREINLVFFELKDFTGRHLNHKQNDGGFHLEAIIVSDDFMGKSLIERHRVVYRCLDKLMKHEIHAFSMKTLTSEEWNSR